MATGSSRRCSEETRSVFVYAAPHCRHDDSWSVPVWALLLLGYGESGVEASAQLSLLLLCLEGGHLPCAVTPLDSAARNSAIDTPSLMTDSPSTITARFGSTCACRDVRVRFGCGGRGE